MVPWPPCCESRRLRSTTSFSTARSARPGGTPSPGPPSAAPMSRTTIPHLKATYEAFGRDPRFVMIALNADETPGPVRRYAAHHGLGWEQRYIGSTYDPNPTKAAFGVWSPPAVFLIGPDGRILAKDLE